MLAAILSDRLRPIEKIRFALLFGSRADGSGRPDSDLDVAVFVDPSLSEKGRWDLRLRLIAELSDLGEPDVVILNDAPPLLGHRALLGKVIDKRDPVAYVRYFVRTIAMSEDERYFRDIHREARGRRLEEGRFGRP